MNDPSGLSNGAATIPDHELIVRIGGGSYGEVWLARSALGATRAVKVINRKSFEDDRPFEREFNGIKRFEPISRSHDGLVDILQVGRQQEYFYYVMELADDARPKVGGNGSSPAKKGTAPKASGQVAAATLAAENYVPRTLRQSLNDNGRLPVSECVEIGLALTSALAHMHRHGLVHRDIKPSNIIFVQGAAKLADIGLVTEADTTLSYVGTEGYIPPEGPGAIQADIFSLGKVLYEMATGQDRRQFPDLPTALNEWPDRAAVLEVNEVLLKACARDVLERYQDCEELHADLARLQRGQSVKRHHLWQRRRGFLKTYGLAAAAVALLIFAGMYVNRVRRGHVPDPKAEREYKLGQWYYGQLTPGDHKKAMKHLRQATEIDPRFVLPYRELIALYVWGKAGLFPDDEEKMRELKQIADKLITMNSKLGEGHTALSWWHFLNGDVRAAEGEIVQAIDHDPSYPIARDVYTYYLCMLGRPADAHQQAERAQELDPTSRTSGVVAAWPYFAARKFDQAIVQLQRVLELDKDFPEALNFLARCYEAQSKYVAAIETWKTADLMTCQNSNRVIAGYAALRQAYDADGEPGYLRKYIQLIREDESLPEEEQVFYVADVAGYFARLGETNRALEAIAKNFDKPNVRAQLKFEPFYDGLHDHPKFKELLRRARIEP